MDLPHYHGVGVPASPAGGAADAGAIPRATIKETTGA
jgi:hypothetical protein